MCTLPKTIVPADLLVALKRQKTGRGKSVSLRYAFIKDDRNHGRMYSGLPRICTGSSPVDGVHRTTSFLCDRYRLNLPKSL